MTTCDSCAATCDLCGRWCDRVIQHPVAKILVAAVEAFDWVDKATATWELEGVKYVATIEAARGLRPRTPAARDV